MMRIEGFRGEIRKNERLAPFTGWKVGGPAEYLVLPADEVDVERAVERARGEDMPWIVIGNGSNLLVADDGVPGMVIRLPSGLKSRSAVAQRRDEWDVYFGAGVLVGGILAFSLRHGLSGAEFLAGVPGSMGGLLRMNCGAFGSEVMSLVKSLCLYVPGEGFVTLRAEELRYGYRELALPGQSVITGGVVRLKRSGADTVRRNIGRCVALRREKQPLGEPTCGSVFRNPPGTAAGRLIDEVGMKGFRVGGARISEKHANFIVNMGTATANDIRQLMDAVQERVWRDREVWLEEEVVMVNIGAAGGRVS